MADHENGVQLGHTACPSCGSTYGVGYIDYESLDKGQVIICPAYRPWLNMLKRCYSGEEPGYQDVAVHEDWWSFNSFRDWYLSQPRQEGWHLDKDLLGNGKLYSAATCCLLPGEVNVMVSPPGGVEAGWEGVKGYYPCKTTGKYAVRLNVLGQRRWIGRYSSECQARAAYLGAKKSAMEEICAMYADFLPLRVVEALRSFVNDNIEVEEEKYV